MKFISKIAWLAQSVPVRDEYGVRESSAPGKLQRIYFWLWILPILAVILLPLLHISRDLMATVALVIYLMMIILLLVIRPEIKKEINWELDRWVNRYLIIYGLSLIAGILYLAIM